MTYVLRSVRAGLLEGAPPSIGGEFICRNNRLASLDHAPLNFGKLCSDFGTFNSWDAVPERLLPRVVASTPAEPQKLPLQQPQTDAAGVMSLQDDLTPARPMRLKPIQSALKR